MTRRGIRVRTSGIAGLLVAAALAAPVQAQKAQQSTGVGTASALKLLDGIWGTADCSTAAPITVFGDKIQFQWPNREAVVEVVTAVKGNRIEATMVSPAARRGERYEYEVGADRLLIRTLATGRESILVRCQRPSG